MTEADRTLTDRGSLGGDRAAAKPPDVLALVLVYCQSEPGRIGEALVPGSMGAEHPDDWSVFGRGEGSPEDPHPRLTLVAMRPGRVETRAPLADVHLSRVQLRVRVLRGETLVVERIGRAQLFHNQRDTPVDRIELAAGDTLRVGSQLLFLAVMRPLWLPPLDAEAATGAFAFGGVDDWGLVGESPAMWALRADIAFAARRPEHVLITGASGTGKEKVARAIHRLASARTLVARNAATFPDGLIDAELFGNARNYPNAGIAERPGLVGEADGGTLFLDEFGELPAALQAHLLRVLDAGEYQRLGESQMRHARFRLIAATNRPLLAIKDDLLARLQLRVGVPGLGERREDLPLLARHLLAEICRGGAASGERAACARAPDDLRLSMRFMRALVQHEYTTHVRELRALLLDAVARARGAELEPASGVAVRPTGNERGRAPTNPADLLPAQIQAALDRNHGNIDVTFRELGLSSRFALTRLVGRYGLRAGRRWTRP